jgi:hypothetical protein
MEFCRNVGKEFAMRGNTVFANDTPPPPQFPKWRQKRNQIQVPVQYAAEIITFTILKIHFSITLPFMAMLLKVMSSLQADQHFLCMLQVLPTACSVILSPMHIILYTLPLSHQISPQLSSSKHPSGCRSEFLAPSIPQI